MPPAPPATVTTDDHALAVEIGADIGRLLLELRASAAAAGLDADRLRDEGDRQAHERIVALLAAARPDDAVLSEEGADDSRRLSAPRVWIVDPLDGTREFGEPGRTDWAVHVALVVAGTPVVGAVALPAQERMLSTRPAPPLPPPRPGPLRVVLSRSRRPAEATRVAEALGAELVPLGSAGAKTMAVVLGHVDAYVHAGGLFQWDSAAPVAVAAAAGLHVSRIDGSPLVYNAAELSLPDLLVCRPELADACLAALGG
ncbi:MAG: 3'(2'),5'-bisphosphate nucleotidase CysQ [Actinobacteria bacterium]|nr:3'(2'),5'-bisphosphate nucleotidase CysQ [Actinomycetota bacterium]